MRVRTLPSASREAMSGFGETVRWKLRSRSLPRGSLCFRSVARTNSRASAELHPWWARSSSGNPFLVTTSAAPRAQSRLMMSASASRPSSSGFGERSLRQAASTTFSDDVLPNDSSGSSGPTCASAALACPQAPALPTTDSTRTARSRRRDPLAGSPNLANKLPSTRSISATSEGGHVPGNDLSPSMTTADSSRRVRAISASAFSRRSVLFMRGSARSQTNFRPELLACRL